ncbi:MAG: CaiB/BaiF CoA-transferase family protein [Pseudomonadota bacterium]
MGPLAGLTVIEMKGIGPGPYAGMLLADMGARVIVVERASKPMGIAVPADKDVHSRGKASIALDLKTPEGLQTLLRLVDGADALIEGFRPGVAERLGFGPEVCHARNPRLVFGRLTGWGQSGPMAQAPGHDINYIGLTGALAAVGPAHKPVVPLNLIGDYAGGSLFLVMGVLAALLEARQSGQGQVVDAAITDGSANLMSGFYGWQAMGFWQANRECNMLDGAAHHYQVYETKDQKFMAVGALEPQFYAEFLARMGINDARFAAQMSVEHWPALIELLSESFRQHTQAHWSGVFEGSEACVTPVLDINEAIAHPHNIARETYIDVAGVDQPAPAPRFSRSTQGLPRAPQREGANTIEVLQQAGLSDTEIEQLRSVGALT